MKFAALALMVLLAPGVAEGQKKKSRGRDKEKPPDVLVVAFKVFREGDKIAVEGKLQNNSALPLKGLVLFLEFIEPGGRMISRMNHKVSDEQVDVGEEGEFLAQTRDQVRAVHVRLDAEDLDGRYLKLDKPGPYAIE